MQEMEVDNETERSGVGELVSVGAPGRLMQSVCDAFGGESLSPIALIKMGHHFRLLYGRYFFLKSSQLASQHMDSHEYDEMGNDAETKAAVVNYHSYVNAHLIKKSLQMHPFYSNMLAGLLKRKRKNHEILKSLESIFETAEKLSDSINKQKELYEIYLQRNLQHLQFHNECVTEIEEHKATLRQQNVDKKAKEKVAEKKSEVKFLAEISSRLLAITLIEDPVLVDVLIEVAEVLDQVR